MTARATVVIVNYNGAHLLPACLDGLRKQDLPAGELRTVVVDNASSDGSVELLRRDYPEVEVVASAANLGFAGGNNLALRRVETPFAVLLNNDAVPDPGWLRALLAPFDQPGAGRLAVTTGKVLFLPRFVRVSLQTPGFSPGPPDRRELGVRVSRVVVGGEDPADPGHPVEPGDPVDPGDDVAAKVIWDGAGFGREGSEDDPFWWTRPEGDLLVPVPERLVGRPLRVTLRAAAQSGARKPLRLWVGPGRAGPAGGPAEATTEVTAELGDRWQDVGLAIPDQAPLVDVINNAGGIVLRDGCGADRGFREVDEGQFDAPTPVFNACGNGMAVRTEVGRSVGWFDDDFFMYYEDTDLSWRIRARGWEILYVPDARLRHIHSASSKEWSPLWLFHVDRNRLLMLTKDATTGLWAYAVSRYVLATLYRVLAAGRQGVRTGSRPAVRPHLLRVRVIASYLRLMPRMLARRRAARRHAQVGAAELQRWLASSR